MSFRSQIAILAHQRESMGEGARIRLAVLALVCVVVVGCAIGFGYNELLHLLEEETVEEPAPSGPEGLPAGTELDAEPNEIIGTYAVFSDRVVKLFKTNEETLGKCVDAQIEMLGVVPNNVNSYLVVMPTRATFEPSLVGYSDSELAAIDSAYAAMPQDVICVDTVSKLQEHADDYLYYRTQRAATSEGAYWTSRAFIEAADVAGIDISEYQADTRQVFNGVYIFQFELSTASDTAPIYVHSDLPNKELVAHRLDNNEMSELYEAPALAMSRGSYYAAIGDRAVFAEIEGAGGNGRTVLVLGDSDSRSFSTWLITSFDRILYVSTDWCPFSHEEFLALFNEYGVTDFVLYQSVDSLSLGNGNTTLLELAGKE